MGHARQTHRRPAAEAEHTPEFIISVVVGELILNLDTGLAAECQSVFRLSLGSSVAFTQSFPLPDAFSCVLSQYLIRQNTSTVVVGELPAQLGDALPYTPRWLPSGLEPPPVGHQSSCAASRWLSAAVPCSPSPTALPAAQPGTRGFHRPFGSLLNCGFVCCRS